MWQKLPYSQKYHWSICRVKASRAEEMTEKNKSNKHKLIRSIIVTDRRQTTPGDYLEAWSRMWSSDYSEEIQAAVRVALMHHDEAEILLKHPCFKVVSVSKTAIKNDFCLWLLGNYVFKCYKIADL